MVTYYYFGQPWSEAAVEGAALIETPVGDRCPMCEDVIADDDRGWLRVTVEVSDGVPKIEVEATHALCTI